jgi:hypothetical protein
MPGIYGEIYKKGDTGLAVSGLIFADEDAH